MLSVNIDHNGEPVLSKEPYKHHVEPLKPVFEGDFGAQWPSFDRQALPERPLDIEELWITQPIPHLTEYTPEGEVFIKEQPLIKRNKRFQELKNLKSQTGGKVLLKDDFVTTLLKFDKDPARLPDPLKIDSYDNDYPEIEVTDAVEEFITKPVAIQKQTDIILEGAAQEVDSLIKDVQPQQIQPKLVKKSFAHLVDMNIQLPEETFKKFVPELAREFKFELDTFQKYAVLNLERGDNIFVSAHTSAGKTVVAEYAIALSQKHMTRTIYTSPIKALSNQKFRDFRLTFGEDEVGLLTGDVQIRPDASCVIMTTEILRSMLYRGADMIRDVEYVIFDECHYLNDLQRGVVWEECLIMLPKNIQIILLSATVPNAYEFAEWVGRVKQKDIFVISTFKRPVPLEHSMFISSVQPHQLFKVVDEHKQFMQDDYKKAHELVFLQKELKLKKKRDADRKAGKVVNTFTKAPVIKIDRYLWVHLVQYLRKSDLLPSIFFSFSKKRCEEYADTLTNIDLLTANEKSEVFVFIERSLARLKGSDKTLPQIVRMRELLGRGIGIHHSGLLPIVKELVEILFTRNLTRVLFCTETFAMGINAPAKAVVFTGTRKNDGNQFRDLQPGEYAQMSGRAGRRGLDPQGVVILAYSGEYDFPEAGTLQQMIIGQPTRMESQFRLTYNMILNLLRIEAIKVEEMLKKSYSENTSQRDVPEQELLLKQKASQLVQLQNDQQQVQGCLICSSDIEAYYDMNEQVLQLNHERMQTFMVDSGLWQKLITYGRLLLVTVKGFGSSLAMVNSVVEKGLFECDVLVGVERSNTPILSYSQPSKLVRLHVHWDQVLFVFDQKLKDKDALVTVHSQVVDQLKSKSLPQEIAVENKFKDIDFIQVSVQRKNFLDLMVQCQCIHCPDFDRHFGLVDDFQQLKSSIVQLQRQLSDKNLYLLPEYEDRVRALKALGFIDNRQVVQLKGRVACEINSGESLVLTEMLTENVFADMPAAEVVALLSAFIFQENSEIASDVIVARMSARAQLCITKTLEIADKVAQVQLSNNLPVSVQEFIQENINFGLVQVVYEWARGTSFREIIDMTDILEGSIVRAITRLDELVREIRDAARVVGNSDLYKTMEEASVLIKRDIVFTTSLYI